MDTQIKKFANQIAKEILERSIMDVDSVALMIEVRLKSSMLDFVNEYSTKEEGEYLKLLAEQSKNKIGSKQYNEIAYKLTFAKAKKAAANRTQNNLLRIGKYDKLKKGLIAKHGRETFDAFLSEEVV